MKFERTVRVQKPLDEVFAYLSDFTTNAEWDPGTVSMVRTTGDGDVGTVYECTSTFAGRQTRLTYVVENLVPNERIALRGENSTLIAHDIMTFRATRGDQAGSGDSEAGSAPSGSNTSGVGSATSGTQVTYTADFAFKGITKFIAPLLKPAVAKLMNEGVAGLAAALERL